LKKAMISLFRTIPIIVALVSLLAAGMALASNDAPVLSIDTPSDDDWFTDPVVRVEGRVGTVDVTTVLGGSVLGLSAAEGVILESGGLVFRTSPYFSDDFEGIGLNMTNWRNEGSVGSYALVNGTLVVGDDTTDPNPRIVSLAGSFPQDMETEWTAEFRIKFGSMNSSQGKGGGGITTSAYRRTMGHMTVVRFGPNSWFEVYAGGQYIESGLSLSEGWHDYIIKYHPDTGKYSAYVDGVYKHTFGMVEHPTKFWFGAVRTDISQYNPIVYVDWARFWTYDGSWRSQVQDLGASALVEGIRPEWSTNIPEEAEYSLQVQVSNDNQTWLPWVNIVRGKPVEEVLGRYLRFRTDVAMPYVKDPVNHITLKSITIEHHYVLTTLEYQNEGQGWQSFNISSPWYFNATLVEDMNQLMVRVTDSRGVTNTSVLHLLLDTTPPTGSIEIEGAGITDSLDINLAVEAQDRYGIEEMHIASSSTFARYTVFPYCETFQFTMDGTDGTVWLFVRFVDIHGLVSEPASDSILVDLTPPSGTVTIAEGADITTTNIISLVLAHFDTNGITLIEVSNDFDFSEAETIDPSDVVLEWDLDMETDGMAWVHVRLTDLAGNQAVVSGFIEFVLPRALGTILIEGGSKFTNSTIVFFEVEVPSSFEVRTMQISEDPTFAEASWLEPIGREIWTLSPGDGPKVLYLRFEDQRGVLSLPVMDDITLDTMAPEVSVSINGGAMFVISSEVELSVIYIDHHPILSFHVGNGHELVDATILPFQDIVAWSIPDIEGEREVFVWVADGAGNIGTTSGAIHFAMVLPQVTILLSQGVYTNAQDRFLIELDITDRYGGLEVQVAVDGYPVSDAIWAPYDPDGEVWVSVTGLHDGDHQIHVRARNSPGLVSDIIAVDLVLDTLDPRLIIVSPSDGRTLTQDGRTVEMVLNMTDGDDGSGLSVLEYRIDGGEWRWNAIDSGKIMVILPSYGTHNIEVKVTDRAGNSANASTEFQLVEENELSMAYFMTSAVAGLLVVLALMAIVHSRRLGVIGEGGLTGPINGPGDDADPDLWEEME